MIEQVVLRDQRDPDGVRSLTAQRSADGGVLIEGQDLGRGVEAAWGAGNTEYEWAWAVPPTSVDAAVLALGGVAGDDVLALLAAWSASHGGIDPGIRLKEAGVPVEFWSRVGE